ncbi:MAG: threonylcarbamoyl-AMP synthase, partial [Alphaproteobacteria bacterium]
MGHSHGKIVAPTAAGIARAVDALRAGALIGLPTETVYGLAGDAADGAAVARIFAAKARPRFNPLICHILDEEGASALARFTPPAQALAARFWPGPLTLVLPRRAGAPVHDLVCAGLETIAVRAPAHKVARAVLAAFGRALAAPSANRSGHLSPTHAAHVIADLGAAVALVLDGGACPVGLESTVVEVGTAALYLLRPGTIDADALEDAAGLPVRAACG